MKKIIRMIITVIIALTLIILGFVFSEVSFNALQIDTLKILLWICGISSAYCFIAGEITRNNSQMDKLWSILPIIYLWVMVFKSSFNLRIVIMAILVTFWGVRLTINFGKKGAYKLKFWEGEEDYRWIVLKQNKILKNKLIWAIFDLFFISIYQNLLVLAICLPALVCMNSSLNYGLWDLLVTILVLGFIILETVADRQQMNFYNRRAELMKDGTPLAEIEVPYNKGFNTLGLWKYSRHPNYFSEQAIWISLYLFVVSSGLAVNGIFHWSMVGCLLLVLLFVGSSSFQEAVSSSKYPLYQEYLKTTSKYLILPNKNK